MGKRINIVLPETTIRTIDGMAKPGQRSRFIDEAVQYFVANRSAEALRAQLERAAIRDRDLDREVTGRFGFHEAAGKCFGRGCTPAFLPTQSADIQPQLQFPDRSRFALLPAHPQKGTGGRLEDSSGPDAR